MRARGLLAALLLTACAAEAPASLTPASLPSPASPPASTTDSTTGPSAPPRTPRPTLTGAELAARIEPADLLAHLEALQRAADGADGNRATGTAGFDASVRYVAETLRSAGYSVEAHTFTADGLPSTNLVVELPGIDDGVIMIGAHLDSVRAGPGINDNGSGVAALLGLATAARDLPAPLRTVRFAFWGAEEGGPFGSAHYVARLSPDARAEIIAYLNLDMLGSPNPIHFVYDEEDAAPGSDVLTAVIGSFVEDAGLPWAPIDLGRRSDHGPFAAAGIPIGGLFSGGREVVTEEQATIFGAVAGQPSDPCSDAACDTIANVDLDVLAIHTRIIAEVIATLTAN